MTLPRVSIITPCLNSARTIGRCIASVRAQAVPVEHIAVDGGSSDDTLDVLRAAQAECPAHVALRIHEGPDAGIYDGMNRGLAVCTGDIVGFLNADDRFAGPHSLSKILEAFAAPDTDAIYGDLVFAREHVQATPRPARIIRRWRAGTYRRSRFLYGWMPPHPTFYARRRCYEQHGGLRLDCGSSADYECMLRLLYRHGVPARYIPEVLVVMEPGGVSNRSLRNRLQAHRMDYRAWRVNGLRPLPFTLPLKPLRKLAQWLPAGRLPAARQTASSML